MHSRLQGWLFAAKVSSEKNIKDKTSMLIGLFFMSFQSLGFWIKGIFNLSFLRVHRRVVHLHQGHHDYFLRNDTPEYAKRVFWNKLFLEPEVL